MESTKEVIIIGGGQAGLAVSYYLKKAGINHLVFEQNSIGSSWEMQRWDSFKMNTPNWMTWLPGLKMSEDASDYFMTKNEFCAYLKKYVKTFDLPVQEGNKVVGLQKENTMFIVTTEENNTLKRWQANRIIIASGMMTKIKFPQLSNNLPLSIKQLHSSQYKNPEQLTEGAIVVIGAGQSGCQIAEELVLAGKKVYLASSRVPRAPRRYKGKDVMEWMELMGIHDIFTYMLKDDSNLHTTQPQSSGIGIYGHTVSYQSLHSLGVTVLGRFKKVQNTVLHFEQNNKEFISFADQTSISIKQSIATYLEKHPELITMDEEPDVADRPDENFYAASDITELCVNEFNISTIIWATGFGYSFDYMPTDLLDETGKPKHQEGKIENKIYCIGFPWLRKKKSGLVYGVREDAEIIAKQIMSKIKDTKS